MYPIDRQAFIELAEMENFNMNDATKDLLESIVSVVNEAYYKGFRDGKESQ
jgi:hypothetical protein